jgi:DnaK suppressor protein
MKPATTLMRKLKEALQKRRASLITALKNEVPAAEPEASEDNAAQINEQMEVDTELIAVESCRLAEVDEALVRIKNGTYGTCEGCGRAIALARLEALPTASRCLNCQKEAEANGEQHSKTSPEANVD